MVPLGFQSRIGAWAYQRKLAIESSTCITRQRPAGPESAWPRLFAPFSSTTARLDSIARWVSGQHSTLCCLLPVEQFVFAALRRGSGWKTSGLLIIYSRWFDISEGA